MNFFFKFTAASEKRKGKDFQGLYTENYKILFSGIKGKTGGGIDQVCELQDSMFLKCQLSSN